MEYYLNVGLGEFIRFFFSPHLKKKKALFMQQRRDESAGLFQTDWMTLKCENKSDWMGDIEDFSAIGRGDFFFLFCSHFSGACLLKNE